MRPPITALCSLLAVALLSACGDDTADLGSDATLTPLTTLASQAATTSTPSTLPPALSPTSSAATSASTAVPTTTPVTSPAPAHGSAPTPGVPGPGSSGCRTTAGDVVSITLTVPMPGPDFCLEIRQSQSLEVVNQTDQRASLAIYQGSADNLFETPELAPGDSFASEAVGEVFPTGEWALEVSTLTGWQGTLVVVAG